MSEILKIKQNLQNEKIDTQKEEKTIVAAIDIEKDRELDMFFDFEGGNSKNDNHFINNNNKTFRENNQESEIKPDAAEEKKIRTSNDDVEIEYTENKRQENKRIEFRPPLFQKPSKTYIQTSKLNFITNNNNIRPPAIIQNEHRSKVQYEKNQDMRHLHAPMRKPVEFQFPTKKIKREEVESDDEQDLIYPNFLDDSREKYYIQN